jgi:hypothetical protein
VKQAGIARGRLGVLCDPSANQNGRSRFLGVAKQSQRLGMFSAGCMGSAEQPPHQTGRFGDDREGRAVRREAWPGCVRLQHDGGWIAPVFGDGLDSKGPSLAARARFSRHDQRKRERPESRVQPCRPTTLALTRASEASVGCSAELYGRRTTQLTGSPASLGPLKRQRSEPHHVGAATLPNAV